MDKRQLKKLLQRQVVPSGLENIFALFSQLENLSLLLQEFHPTFSRLIELLERMDSLAGTEQLKKENLHTKIDELLEITRETRDTSGFVKRVFTQEKPKQSKAKIDKSEAINSFLQKYNKSTKSKL